MKWFCMKVPNNVTYIGNDTYTKTLKCTKSEFDFIKVNDTIGYIDNVYGEVIKKGYFGNKNNGIGILWLKFKERETN